MFYYFFVLIIVHIEMHDNFVYYYYHCFEICPILTLRRKKVDMENGTFKIQNSSKFFLERWNVMYFCMNKNTGNHRLCSSKRFVFRSLSNLHSAKNIKYLFYFLEKYNYCINRIFQIFIYQLFFEKLPITFFSFSITCYLFFRLSFAEIASF